MKKKHWVMIYVAAGCICLLFTFWLLLSQWQRSGRGIDLMQAVPLDAFCLCYFERVSILNETANNYMSWQHLFARPDSRVLQLLKQLDMASSNNKEKELMQTNMIYSLHPQGKNSIAELYIFALPQEHSTQDWELLLKSSGMPVTLQSYHGTQIISAGQGDSLIHTALLNKMALCSESMLLLQNAIRQINSGTSFNDNAEFQEVLKTAGAYTDVRFFINHSATASFITAIGSSKLRPYHSLIPYLANWTALDGQATAHVIHLNGFIFPSPTDSNYLSLLLSQNGGDNTLWAMLPETAAISLNIGFSDVDRFLNGYKYFLDRQKLLTTYRNNLIALSDRLNQDITDFFSSLYVKELGMAYIAGEYSGWVSMIKSDNQRYVLEQLQSIADDLRTPWKVNMNGNAAIYHNPVKGMLSALFGRAFNDNADDYFTVKDNWIIFSNNLDLLVSMHAKSVSLKRRIQSSKASQYSSSNSLLSIFINPFAAANTEIISYLHPLLQKNLTKLLQKEGFKIIGLQMRPTGNKLYTTFFSVCDEPSKLQASEPNNSNGIQQTVATQEIKKTSLRFAVINHNDKSTEYLVQCNDNTIAMLDDKNNEQWSYKIDGPILDKVCQIDFYKNRKLQMLFITSNKIYLTDRKGKTVEKYPLTLPSTAKYISVFDYDTNRDYRIFIGFANKIMRVYDKKGFEVEGWQPFTAKAQLTRAAEYFRVDNRDFIVICDEKNTYILDRKGNERVMLKKHVVVKPDAPIIPQQNPPALKITTPEGKTLIVNLNNGEVNGVEL